jgi:hypothetical protein
MALAGALALGTGRAAHAQTYVQPRVSPYANPGLSPYINLLRPGNPAVNYYGLVLPEIKTNTSIRQLQVDVARTQASVVAPPASLPPGETGHATRFMQYGQYFNTTAPPLSQAGAAAPPAAGFGRR